MTIWYSVTLGSNFFSTFVASNFPTSTLFSTINIGNHSSERFGKCISVLALAMSVASQYKTSASNVANFKPISVIDLNYEYTGIEVKAFVNPYDYRKIEDPSLNGRLAVPDDIMTKPEIVSVLGDVPYFSIDFSGSEVSPLQFLYDLLFHLHFLGTSGTSSFPRNYAGMDVSYSVVEGKVQAKFLYRLRTRKVGYPFFGDIDGDYPGETKTSNIIQYFTDNTTGIDSYSRQYWNSLDFTGFEDEAFFKIWVTFCSIVKVINDSYYYNRENPSYPKVTPVKFTRKTSNSMELLVSLVIDKVTMAVKNHNVNGYMMVNNGSSFNSSTYRGLYNTETPFFYNSTTRANRSLQLLWDAARVLKYFQDSVEPGTGDLKFTMAETTEGDYRATIKSIVQMSNNRIPLVSETSTP